MARPRIFDKEPRSLHIYLQPEQYAKLKKLAHDTRKSPSAIVRKILDETLWDVYTDDDKRRSKP